MFRAELGGDEHFAVIVGDPQAMRHRLFVCIRNASQVTFLAV